MALSDFQIKQAKPGEKIVKLSDGGGLQLWIQPNGAKYWRMAYRFDGKQKVLAIGVYPQKSLKQAREDRDAARRKLAEGRDPSQDKRIQKAARVLQSANTFAAIAGELLDKKRRERKSAGTLKYYQWLASLTGPLAERPIADISAADVLAALKAIEASGRLNTAHRLRAAIGEVFRYAIATMRCDRDPTTALRGAIAQAQTVHRAAIVEPAPFGALLRAIDGYHGAPETRIALQLLALTFVRPGELRAAEWSEFDLEAAVWTIPSDRMKKRRLHRVPLAPQAVALLKDLRTFVVGDGYCFPNIRTPERCLSEGTLNAGLRALGFTSSQMTAHGFRAAASSMLNESRRFHPDAIERQLAHADKDDVRAAYSRADFWDERVAMMAWWAHRCDELRSAPAFEKTALGSIS